MAYAFTPPTRTERVPMATVTNGLFRRLHWEVGQTVLKEDGAYVTVIEPTSERVAAAQAAYLGGRTYTIDSTARAELIAAGYGAYISGAP